MKALHRRLDRIEASRPPADDRRFWCYDAGTEEFADGEHRLTWSEFLEREIVVGVSRLVTLNSTTDPDTVPEHHVTLWDGEAGFCITSGMPEHPLREVIEQAAEYEYALRRAAPRHAVAWHPEAPYSFEGVALTADAITPILKATGYSSRELGALVYPPDLEEGATIYVTGIDPSRRATPHVWYTYDQHVCTATLFDEGL